jgi:hypothetical protein
MRTKTVSDVTLNNLFEAIEKDAILFQDAQEKASHQITKAHKLEMQGLQIANSEYRELPSSGIINLRFEECKFTSKAVSVLKNFFAKKQLIETLVISKVEF